MTHPGMLQQPPSEPPAELVADISARLGRVCQDYSREDFTELVRQIALIRAKYDAMHVEFLGGARSFAAERLVQRLPPEDHEGGGRPR